MKFVFSKSNIVVLAFLTAVLFLFWGGTRPMLDDEAIKQSKALDVLAQLGDKVPLHYKPYLSSDQELVKRGAQLFHVGKTINPSTEKKTKKLSKHFVCSNCHNSRIEDPNLKYSNPETRLAYAKKNGLKFLPATTMAGTVNKNHWYNGDYIKKYGDLVKPAKDTLVNAIQLCAVECSQGRLLEKWEMDAMLAYLQTLGYSIADLNLNPKEFWTLKKALDGGDKRAAIEAIKGSYLDHSPATFLDPTPKKERALGVAGDPEKGKDLYSLSCMTCHHERGITSYKLNRDKTTFQHLKFWSKKSNIKSLYEITRKGTYALPGYKPYMPNYTKERLSYQQIEDLMAYINQEAKK